jgi:hypothetical protein
MLDPQISWNGTNCRIICSVSLVLNLLFLLIIIMIQKPKRLLTFVMFFSPKSPKELVFITSGMGIPSESIWEWSLHFFDSHILDDDFSQIVKIEIIQLIILIWFQILSFMNNLGFNYPLSSSEMLFNLLPSWR